MAKLIYTSLHTLFLFVAAGVGMKSNAVECHYRVSAGAADITSEMVVPNLGLLDVHTRWTLIVQ